MKRLLDTSEEKAFSVLKEVADRCGYEVFPKVRVADVLPIENSGISSDLYGYALKAHFDFVVYGMNRIPEFVVEFDGASHQSQIQKNRDQKKNELCKRFRLPILRTIWSHISKKYRDITILAWIIDVYSLQNAFYEAQEEGLIPDDEPFDPLSIIVLGREAKRFPYWISVDAKIAIQQLNKQGKIKDWGTSGFIGYDGQDVMRGIEFIRVTEHEGLSVESAMRRQDFPIMLSDLFDEVLNVLLFDKLQLYFAGNARLQPIDKIIDRAEELKSQLKMARAHSTSGSFSV